jgi:hypothetical protein
MAPAYVKPYVKRQKNDATDAEAICEAVTRANMRFVETKTPEQQCGLVLHRTRHPFIRQQTAVINAIRAHLAPPDHRPPAEYGRSAGRVRENLCIQFIGPRRCGRASVREQRHRLGSYWLVSPASKPKK